MKLKEVRKIRDKVCKGCTTYEFGLKFGSPCNIPHKMDGYTCPCSTCLIKSMCQETCDEVEYYMRRNVKRINKKKHHPKAVITDDVTRDSMYELHHPPDLFK